jgi:hypothetical protein
VLLLSPSLDGALSKAGENYEENRKRKQNAEDGKILLAETWIDALTKFFVLHESSDVSAEEEDKEVSAGAVLQTKLAADRVRNQ